MDQQYSFEIVFLGYSIWVLHRVLHGVGLRVLSSPKSGCVFSKDSNIPKKCGVNVSRFETSVAHHILAGP